jgi:hypothetical protein
MLQNRVDPLGNIIITPARGSLVGNRGVIHNEHKQITHPFKHKAWIACSLEFKGRKRTVMTPGRWTELFFLDEATAFAAGHRPCFECRREDAQRFKFFWIQGNASYNLSMNSSIKEIDEVIHRERIDSEKKKVVHQRLSSQVPEGTFILFDADPYIVAKKRLHRWTPFGYETSITLPQDSMMTVLTPNSIVNAFHAGYIPEIATASYLPKIVANDP